MWRDDRIYGYLGSLGQEVVTPAGPWQNNPLCGIRSRTTLTAVERVVMRISMPQVIIVYKKNVDEVGKASHGWKAIVWESNDVVPAWDQLLPFCAHKSQGVRQVKVYPSWLIPIESVLFPSLPLRARKGRGWPRFAAG